ncbi:hypothetical protein AB6A40_003102 [Gnathostoma spinigerum]|uniref:Oligopeptide transporter n=1 Tax=Gnathostoma spinigerum TaxID=75299 RepID=A0ABD6EHG1_9BILA
MTTGKGLIASLRSYPIAVFFMLGNEFCERFSFAGMRAILTLYLIQEHHFRESQASLFYHAFVSLAYFTPLFGSIAADNYFGRFRVILWVSLIYVIGQILLAIGALPFLIPTLKSVLDFGGLFIIAIGTGGIKPCVSAFAADQFDENQTHERAQFFSFFYFAINAGSLVAILLTPILRGRVKCFGSEYCFPLAFGVPGVLMLIAFIFFIAGWKYYKISPPPRGNDILHVIACIFYAARKKISATIRGQKKLEDWLDHAAPKYSEELLVGVKTLVAVATLYLPLVVFWALFDQQGSTWVLQGRRMDGRIGPFTILPDQMNILNPLLVLILVPLFEAVIYPTVRRCCTVTPLRKMGAGGLLGVFAFVVAGFVQLAVNKTMEPLPEPGKVFLQRLGDSSQPAWLNGTEIAFGKNELDAGMYELSTVSSGTFTLNMTKAESGYVLNLFQLPKNETSPSFFKYDADKAENGKTRLYLALADSSELFGGKFYVIDSGNNVVADVVIESGVKVDIQPPLISSPYYKFAYGPGHCTHTECKYRTEFYAQMGGVYVVQLITNSTLISNIVRPNTVNILWQLPQLTIITFGEILISITGLEFSYSQAAPNMKSVLQAFWLLTSFFGNLIDMAISGSHIVAEPALEFFVYAILMLIVMGVFIALSMRYEYVEDKAVFPTQLLVDEKEDSSVLETPVGSKRND